MSAQLHRMGGVGPPLIMIHGFGADRMTWTFLGPTLMEDFTVYVVDLPGHGAAGNDVGDGSFAALADSLEAELPERPIRVVGHSMGGAVALELARRGHVSHGVLIAPAGLGKVAEIRFSREFLDIETADDATRVLGMLVSKARLVTPQMTDYVLAALAKDGRRAALQKIASKLSEADATLPANVPMAVIWGALDAVLSPPASLPRGSLHILNDAGHMPHVEAVSRVSKIVLKALVS